MKVADILSKKQLQVVTLPPSAPVIDALRLMDDKNIGSVVIASDGNYLGLVSERDYSRKVILKGKNSTDTQVSEIMSTDLPAIAPADTIDYCMELMSDKKIRYLPVFEADKMVGIISMSDVVAAKMKRQQETIAHLESYISGA